MPISSIRRVAVLGAGTMGSRIAAHLANARIPVLLLDVAAEEGRDRDAVVKAGLAAARSARPPAFFTEEAVHRVATGNFTDDLEAISGCDWVIEAVTEDLEIKRSLWARVAAARRPGSIVSTNTSGISLSLLSAGWPEEMRRRFLGTHFFNPPRYLHLVEIIPGAETDPTVLEDIREICDRRLGKGVVLCKDTPNFIANRIGSFFGATVVQLTTSEEYTIEQADVLTGPLIGLPGSASFRLLDIIGLDTWLRIAHNLHSAVPQDPWRARFLPAPFQEEMLRRGWLGDKTGQGFYKRVGTGKEIWAIDWKTLEYHPVAKVSFPSLDVARNIEDLPARLRRLVSQNDRAGNFLWRLFRDLLLYSVSVIPEESDRIVEVDRAMRWGYAHSFGPFELWDALGFEETVRRIEKEGFALPENVERMLSQGATSFYQPADRDGLPRTRYFDLVSGGFRELEPGPGVLALAELKRARGVVLRNAGASLIDLGDGVLCLEFHGVQNALGDDQIEMIHSGLRETERSFLAMVIANEGDSFSTGFNLMRVLLAAQEKEWDELETLAERLQTAGLAIKYAAKPVVAAPRGRALGGGCEIVLHASRVQAPAELYMGLAEWAAGLTPSGGGSKELLLRLGDPARVFDLIGSARVSSSAEDARRSGLLGRNAAVSMNPKRVIADAKAQALLMARNYAPGAPRQDIDAGGEAVFAALKLKSWLAHRAGRISAHDQLMSDKLAFVLSGGRLTGRQKVSEQYLLDLEREAFLSLCGNSKTQERMEHLLRTGRPLRN